MSNGELAPAEGNLIDGILGNTVGLLYSAATGSVDPWTKQSLIDQETAALVNSGQYSATDASEQAQSDVSNTLVEANADPSQVSLSNALAAPINNLIGQPLTNANPLGSNFLSVASGLLRYVFLGTLALVGVLIYLEVRKAAK